MHSTRKFPSKKVLESFAAKRCRVFVHAFCDSFEELMAFRWMLSNIALADLEGLHRVNA